jgi:hypothetical protein
MTREQIKLLRKTQKLSQAELGKRSNLTASEISRIECGYKTLTEDEAAAIATALGTTSKIGAGLAKAADPDTVAPAVASKTPVTVTATTASATAAPAATTPAVSCPSGSDLSDPANFGVLPETGILQQGSLDETAFRTRLAAEVSRANTILHTPRVPAAVWRAWRQFEQQATALLRGEVATKPAAPAPVVPPAQPSVQPASAAAVPAKLESKSFNSLFVETARELLPADISARIGQAAEVARQADPSIGFMKHFRALAQTELDPAQLKKVTDETNRRVASPDRSRARRGRRQSSAAAK